MSEMTKVEHDEMEEEAEFWVFWGNITFLKSLLQT